MAITVQALDHLVVQVSDLETSASWYARVLGMTREDVPQAGGKPPRTEMKFGRQKINLRPIATSKADWFTADHEAPGREDLCFLTNSKPEEVVRHLQAQGVAIVAGPGPRRGAQGALTSVYCRDPDKRSHRDRVLPREVGGGGALCSARTRPGGPCRSARRKCVRAIVPAGPGSASANPPVPPPAAVNQA